MSVFRINKTKDYTVMSNSHLKEKEMSLKAKGLLSVMLSLPDTWDYSINGLVAISKENQTAIENTLKELKEFGYLRVDKIMPDKSNSGRIEYVYNIFETPQKQGGEKQALENLPLENQGVENRPQLNTNKSMTNELNIKNNKKEEKGKKPVAFDDIINNYTENETLRTALIEFIKMRKTVRKPVTSHGLELLLTKKGGLFDLSGGNDEIATQIVNQSIELSWTGFYPLKTQKVEKQQESIAERIARL